MKFNFEYMSHMQFWCFLVLLSTFFEELHCLIWYASSSNRNIPSQVRDFQTHVPGVFYIGLIKVYYIQIYIELKMFF